MRGKVLPYMPAFQPYRGKPAVRNDREGRGNIGIIRSPVRASTLPDCGGREVTRVPTASVSVCCGALVRFWHDSDESQCSDSPLLVEADIGVLRSWSQFDPNRSKAGSKFRDAACP